MIFHYSDGPHLRKVNNKDTFCDHSLKGTDVAFKAARSQLITDLISSLEKRFSDTTRGIFQATHIAKISSWPSAKTLEELESTVTHFLFVLSFCDFLNLSATYIHLFKLPYFISDFGDQELQVILAHYGNGLQSAGIVLEEVETEWTSLKAAIYDEQ